MSKVDTLRPDSRPTLLQRVARSWMRAVDETGVLGFGLRWGVLSDVKDPSKPTWVLAVSWATPYAEKVYNPRSGASK